jgi:flagellar biosynthetic protein FlhB
MAEGQEKTEKPTPRRLSEARKRGQVAKSNDFNSAIVLGAVALILSLYGAYFFQSLSRLSYEFLSHELRNSYTLDLVSFQILVKNTIYHIVILAMPFLAGAMLWGIVANFFQVRFLFTLQPLKPSLSKLNIVSGFKRLLSIKSIVELAKGIAKMAIVASCGFSIVYSKLNVLTGLGQTNFAQAWMVVMGVILQIAITIAIVLIVLGIADWWWQHYNLMKQLKMTKQEVKDEFKNMEGNQQIKRKIKGMGQALVRKKMLKSVSLADVIITNPTHFAVAIQYDPDEAPAPRVVGKGADHLAFQIRELAKEHNIPIVENKPLARSIYAMVEVDHMIPPELFVAVAEILAFVFKRNKGRYRAKRKWMYERGGVR